MASSASVQTFFSCVRGQRTRLEGAGNNSKKYLMGVGVRRGVRRHQAQRVCATPASSRGGAMVAAASGTAGAGDALKAAFVAAAAAATISLAVPGTADAGTPKGQGVASTDEMGRTDVDRCSVEALGKGASTRAAFSDFATQQNKELYVNVEGCDFSNMDLSKEVLSGIKARGANFSNSIFGPEVRTGSRVQVVCTVE